MVFLPLSRCLRLLEMATPAKCSTLRPFMTKPEFLYHCASPDNRQSILSLGLSVLFDKTGFNAIFLTDTRNPQSATDYWEVDVRELSDIELDSTTESSGEVWWMYTGNIAPSRLRLVTAEGDTVTPKRCERAFGMFAAATKQAKRPWNHIYGSRFQVEMCDATPVAIEVRILEAALPDCYFAWHDFKCDELAFVYPSEELVRMCDPGGFEPAIARGEGQVVPVTISAFSG
jgi:hypothetical protein